MPTSRDVASVAGVSQATVSRALNKPESVSRATREVVLSAVDQLGYHPHSGAVAMKTKRTYVIGLIVAELSNPFYLEVLEETTKFLSEQGYRVVVWDSSYQAEDAVAAINGGMVDGVIVSAWSEDSEAMRAALASDRPMVLLNRRASSNGSDSVTSDNRAGGRMVADYLVDHRKKDVVFVAGRKETSTAIERRTGFFERLDEVGSPVKYELFGAFQAGIAAEEIKAFVDIYGAPSAVFCANDIMAIGVLNGLCERGIRVPEDTWVIGYDDVDAAGWPIIDLTTVRQSSRDMAREGASILLERLEDPSRPLMSRTFPTELVVRGTTANARPER